jgi:hypothetical protein
MKYWTVSNSCCHYNYSEVTKINPIDEAPELASPSCLQVHPENIIMPKHSSPVNVTITNTPVNKIATQLEKNAWKNTGRGSETDCGRCGVSLSYSSRWRTVLKAMKCAPHLFLV